MLDYFRSNAQSFGVKCIFGLIILVFIGWGVGSFTDHRSGNVVATVNGEPITINDFERAYQQAESEAITRNPAMTREQAAQALLTGIDLVREQREAGVRLLATGEMGIGNTTTSSAVASVLLSRPVPEMTGRGAGLSGEGLRRKIRAIESAIRVNQPDPSDPLDVLAKLGGFDLAGMCGIFLGGALFGVPVLADGFISTVAALCAVRLCPKAKKAVFASHVSAEPAGRQVLDALGLPPLITAGMRLGEGTGAVAAIPLLDMALSVFAEGDTFEESGIERYVPLGDTE